MDLPQVPHRCPKCNAQVVDRRSAVCTTCRAELPKEWVMTPEQTAKMRAIDKEIRAEHASSMKILDPQNNPDIPPLIKLLDSDASGLM